MHEAVQVFQLSDMFKPQVHSSLAGRLCSLPKLPGQTRYASFWILRLYRAAMPMRLWCRRVAA